MPCAIDRHSGTSGSSLRPGPGLALDQFWGSGVQGKGVRGFRVWGFRGLEGLGLKGFGLTPPPNDEPPLLVTST